MIIRDLAQNLAYKIKIDILRGTIFLLIILALTYITYDLIEP